MSKAKTEIIYRTVSLTVWKRLLPILLYAGLVSVTGCAGINKEITKNLYPFKSSKKGEIRYHSDMKYKLTDVGLKQMDFAGPVCAGNVEAYYQQGLQNQAECIANKTTAILSNVEKKTGLQISYKTKFYLIRLDIIPQNFDISFKDIDPNFCIPLFVEAGNESCESIITENILYPSPCVHELAEMSLVFRRDSGRVMPDFGWILPWPNISNQTRWFREGFANYAGYLAYETIRPDINLKDPYAALKIYLYPFSSLSKVRKKLFAWNNYSSSNLDNDYYNASLGLFLLIRNLFGEQAIREIILNINTQDYLNGQDLIRIVNEVLGTDIEKLAENFYFPRTGLKTEMLTPATTLNEGLDVAEGLFVNDVEPNSLADKAGIKKGDVIQKVEDKPIINNLDFELAILDALDRKAVKLTVWKKENREIAELQLPID